MSEALHCHICNWGLCTQCADNDDTRISTEYESSHPYLKNMRYTELISFPGASKLVVTFSKETETENGE